MSNDDTPYDDCFYNYEREIRADECCEFVTELVPSAADGDDVTAYYETVTGDEQFRSLLEASLSRTDLRPDSLWPNWRDVLYALVRTTEPETIVETGVFDGLSSAYLLKALEDNGTGTLVSIDIEETKILPSDLENPETGWAVPEPLRDHWELRIGDAREILPAVCEDHSVDMFLHDSNHDEDHMRFEFETVVEAMPTGAVLLADNVEYNDAFGAFAADHLTNVTKLANARKSLQRDGGVVENDKLGAGVVR